MDTFCPLNVHVLSMILLFAFLRTLPCVLNKLDLSMLPGALNRLSLSVTLPFVLLSGTLNRLSLSMTLPFVLLSGALNRLSLSVTSLSGALLWALIHSKIIRAATFQMIRLTKIESTK